MSAHIDLTEDAANYYVGKTLALSVPIEPFIFDTDRRVGFKLYVAGTTADQIIAGTAVPEDATGKTFTFTVRRKPKDDDVVIYKISGDGISVVGAFDPDPTNNTQYIEVFIQDTDTFDEDASPSVYVKPGLYHYALKCIDDDVEDVKVWGTWELMQTSARE